MGPRRCDYIPEMCEITAGAASDLTEAVGADLTRGRPIGREAKGACPGDHQIAHVRKAAIAYAAGANFGSVGLHSL